MFRRFAAASAVAGIAIAVALLAVVLTHTLTVPNAYPLSTLWCFAPLVWGIWAAIAPKSWVPQRLPIWGAILGLFAGLFGMFILNLPHVLFDHELPVGWKLAIVAGLMILYLILWVLVRAGYRAMGGAEN
jgi:hypothetical protein